MNIEELSQRLKDVLWSDELLKVLPEVGWNDGGCRSLMRAFQLWLGSENTVPYQIVKTIDQHHSEHALVRVGAWFLDGDGISTHLQLLLRWHIEEGFENVIIRPFKPDLEPAHTDGELPYYISEAHIHELIRMLDRNINKKNLLSHLRSYKGWE